MIVHATLDSRPVPLVGWQASMVANHGSQSLSGRLPSSVTWAEQEAPLDLWLADGTLRWSGTLSLDPWLTDDMWEIRAEGYGRVLEEVTDPLLYRRDGSDGWVEREADPHNIGDADKYELRLKPSLMKWGMGNAGSDSFTAGDAAGFLIWLPGREITRYDVVSAPAAAYAAFDFVTRRFTGPTGTRTIIATHSLNIGSPTTRAQTITTPEDGLMFTTEANTSAASSTRRSHIVRSIKIYGRTNDDTFSASEVVADVGADAGFDTSGVQTNALGVLPLDWDEDHASLLDYMAELTDWRWLVVGDTLEFGPWERTWTAFSTHGAAASLSPEPRYNRVVVPFRYVSEAPGEGVGVPGTDPFPGSTVTLHADELEHPQTTTALADAVAAALAEYHASVRVVGSVVLSDVRDAHGAPRDPNAVSAGDVVDLPDLGLVAQRIAAVTYREGSDPTVDLGDDFSVDRIIREQRKGRSAARWRKRRKRR